jgi:hypothetical protein
MRFTHAPSFWPGSEKSHPSCCRQQRQLRDALVSRDATIAGLNEMLGKAIASSRLVPIANTEHADGIEPQATAQLITELRHRLASEVARREKIERRLGTLTAERDGERQQRRIAEERDRELRQELELAESSLSASASTNDPGHEPPLDLEQTVLLYVGGRPHQVAQLRALAERSGASFLYHDGGIEDRSGLLEAQVSRADVVLFPVDCVSHGAVATVKRVAHHAGKPYVALRSSGLTSLAAGLRRISAQRQAGDVSVSSSGIAGPAGTWGIPARPQNESSLP